MKSFACLMGTILLGLCSLAALAEDEQPGIDTATHREGKPLGKSSLQSPTCMTIDAKGNVVVTDGKAKAVVIIAPDDKVVKRIEVEFMPTAVCIGAVGSVYVGGPGTITKLDGNGKVLKTATGEAIPKGAVSSLCVDGRDVYATFAYGGTAATRGLVLRLSSDLDSPKAIASGYRAYCGIFDAKAKDGMVYIAENAGHHVVVLDRQGNLKGEFGKRNLTSVDGFGGCCNPGNLFFGADGQFYTSEKTPNRVKRYDVKGHYISLVGCVGVARPADEEKTTGCIAGPMAANADGSKVYVLDVLAGCVRVLEKK